MRMTITYGVCMSKICNYALYVDCVSCGDGRRRDCHPWVNTVSVLGQEEGYTIKYTPLPEGAPEGEARGNS